MANDKTLKEELKNDYQLIPMKDITDEARLIAVAWVEGYEPQGMDIPGKQKLASDIMNYNRRHQPSWTKRKPDFTEECLLIVANEFGKGDDKYWDYDVFQIKKLDGENDKGEPCWYWGILTGDGDEWGDLEDLAAQNYLTLPLLK